MRVNARNVQVRKAVRDRRGHLAVGPRVIEKAKQRDVGVVVMKTLMDARLNDMHPYERAGATFAQPAFRWVLSDCNVDGLVVSMTGRESIDEYLGASGSRTVGAADLPLLEHHARLNGTSYCKHTCDECACPGRESRLRT
jgi:predicted aldo/keto reductase-like oxidoreductase